MENALYTYSPIVDRSPLSFPNGKTLAFYVGLNVEHFHVDVPSRSAFAPDPLSIGQRDYGTRVGIWRMFDLFDSVGVRASAITNSDVCRAYPQIVEAGVAREWSWIAHGQTNSILHSGMDPEEEATFLGEMFKVFDASLPSRPKGWLGPGLSETFNTPQLLRDHGVTYLLDWCCDDQPFGLEIPGMISVPYTLEVNDISMWLKGQLTGPEYERCVLDQFEVLLADSATSARVMSLPLHTFVTGQPYLFKYLARVLREICAHDDVWVTTSDAIAEHYIAQTTADPAVTA